MRFLLKRSKLLFALLPIMAIIFYALTYSPNLKASVTFKPVEKVDNILPLKEPPASGTPSDYSPLDNIAFANYILFHANYFQGVSNGSVEAKVGFINYTQTVYGLRKVKDGALFSQSISTSSMKNIAEQQYISGDTYLYRPGSKIKGNSAEFGDVYQMGGDAYMIKYGMPPFELAKYVINEETVLDAKPVSFPSSAGGGDYVYGFTLDPALSTEYYQNEVRTLSGSSSEYPQFESVYIEITIGSDWYAKSMTVTETYVIDKPIKATVTGTLTEVFSDINVEGIDVPEAEPFLAFVPTDDPVDDPAPQPDPEPTDYLAAAFGKYILGEPLNLDCKIAVPAYKLDLNVKLNVDLEHKYADVLVDDTLYVGYRGDKVYLQAGTLKAAVSTDAFIELAPQLLEKAQILSPQLQNFLKDFDFEALKGDSLMELLFADATVESTDDATVIVMPFMLSGVKFDIAMNLSPEPYEFVSIDARISILTVGADVTVVPCDAVEMPTVDDSFVDLTAAADFLLPALETAVQTRFDLTLNGSFKTPLLSDTVSGTVSIDRDLRAQGSVKLDKLGLIVDVTHADDTLYLKAGNLAVKLADRDVLDLLPFDRNAAPDLSGLDLGAIFSHLTSISVDGNVLTAVLSVDGTELSIALRRNDTVLTGLTVQAPDVNGMQFAFDVTLDCGTQAVEPIVPQNAVDALALVDFIKPYLSAKEIRLDLTQATACGLTIKGFVRVSPAPLAVEADLTCDGLPVRIVIQNDTVYVSAGAIKLQGALADLPDVIRQCGKIFGKTIELPTLDVGTALQSLQTPTLENDVLQIALGDGYKVTLAKTDGGSTVSVTGELVDVTAAVSTADVFAPVTLDDGRYVAIADALAFLQAAAATVTAPAFTLGGNATVTVNTADGVKTYTVENVAIEAAYVDGVAYATVGNLAFAVSKEKILGLLPNIDLAALDALRLGSIAEMLTDLTVNGNTLTAAMNIKGVGLSVTLTHDGDKLTGINVRASNVLGADVAFEGTITARDALAWPTVPQNTVDPIDLVRFVKPLIGGKQYTLTVEQTELCGLTVVGSVRVTTAPLAVEADLTCNGLPVRLVLQNKTLCVDAGAVKLTGTTTELPALIRRTAAALGLTLPDTLALLGGAQNAFDAQTLLSYVRTLAFDGNALSLTVAAGTHEIAVALDAENTVTVCVGDVTVEGKLTKSATAAPIQAQTDGYTAVADAVDALETVMRTIRQDRFTLTGSVAVSLDSLVDTVAFTANVERNGNVQVAFRLENMGIEGTVTKFGDTLYVECGQFRLSYALGVQNKKTAKAAIPLPSIVKDLLPAGVVSLIETGSISVADVFELIGGLQTLSIADGRATVEFTGGALGLTLSVGYGDTLTDANAQVTVTRNENKTPVALGVTATLSQSADEIVKPQGAFIDIATSGILHVLEGLKLTADISAQVTTDNGSSVYIGGTLTAAVRNGQPEFALAVTAFDTTVDVRLYDGKLYLRVGDLRLTLNRTEDEQAFLTFVRENLPPFVGQFLESFLSLDIDGMLNRPVGGDKPLDVDGLLSKIDLTDGLTLRLPIKNGNVTVRMPWPKNGTIADARVDVSINQTLIAVALDAPTLSPIDETFDLTPALAETYVDLMDFAAFLQPIAATFKAQGFELTVAEDITVDYDGKAYVTDANGKAVRDTVTDEDGKTKTTYRQQAARRNLTIAKGSVVRIIPEGVMGEAGYFINLQADLTLVYTEEVVGVGQYVKSRTNTDKLSVTLVRERGGKFFYIDYNGLKIKLSYEEVMGMLGYAKQIIDLPPTILDDLTKGLYDDTLDTSIFKSMDIAGLDNAKTTIVDMLGTVERAVNVITGDGKNQGVLTSIRSLMSAATLPDAVQQINAITSILNLYGFIESKTDDDIIATFGSILHMLGNVTLSFDNELLTVTAPIVQNDEAITETITLGHNGKTLSALRLDRVVMKSTDDDGNVKTTAVNGQLALKVTDDNYAVTIAPPVGSDKTFNNTPDAVDRGVWNDFGPVRELFENLIDTANLKSFHIGGAGGAEYGTIKLVIPEVIGINMKVTVDIPFVLKVDLKEVAPDEYKPSVYLRLDTTGIGKLYEIAVNKAITQLYFYDNAFLFTRTTEQTQLSTPDWNDTTYWTKTEYVHASVADLLKKNAEGNLDVDNLMKYVYFMLPLTGTVQDPINKAIQSGITKDFSNKQEILNRFAYSDNSYTVNLDIGELSRIQEINDLNVQINTHTYGDTQYIDNLKLDIGFLYGTTGISKGILLYVDGYLVDPKPNKDLGKISYYDHTRPNDKCPEKLNGWLVETHYHRDTVVDDASMSDIPYIISHLGGGTIDVPYYRVKNT